MNEKLFKILLKALSPKTLAAVARDLEENQADWSYFPEDAPPQAIQKELAQAFKTIKVIGTELAEADGLNFSQLLQQVTEEQQQEDWTWQRDRQERQNWTHDLE